MIETRAKHFSARADSRSTRSADGEGTWSPSQNFDDTVCKANARRLVTEGNVAKFQQNPQLRDFLLSTGDAVLVEASPRDCIWGIGLGQDNPKALNPSTWRGRTCSALR